MPVEIIKQSPIYEQLFQGTPQVSWDNFKSKEEDLSGPLSQRAVDFSIQDQTPTWKDTLQSISLLFLKCIVLLPWGIYDGVRYLTQRLVMTIFYPLQSNLLKIAQNREFGTQALDTKRKEATHFLNTNGYIVRHVSLEKNGTRYSGLLVGHRDTIHNGKWAIQAGGNFQSIEGSADVYAPTYRHQQFNTLLINGPGVGRSEGEATPQTMGEAQALGITFLESGLKAKKIVIAGLSLGGAAMGQAIMQHSFKSDVDYLVVRQVTFDRASNIGGEFVQQLSSKLCTFAKRLIPWCGVEMDSVAASRKLQELGIKEVIVQSTNKDIPLGTLPAVEDFNNDGVIPAQASLGYRLIAENITQNKIFCCINNLRHNGFKAILPPEAKAHMAFMERPHPLAGLYTLLHQPTNALAIQTQLYQLPDTLRNSLYFKIWQLSCDPHKNQDRWGENQAVNNPRLLQRAIEVLVS